jgi:hypothetical protein
MGLLGLMGCGVREPNTGSLEGRVYNLNGDVVPNAQVYSLFNELEKANTKLDGSFYISELPAGKNRIVTVHQDYSLGETVVDVVANQHVRLEKIVLESASQSQKISETQVESVSSTTAVLVWKTYKPFRCRIEYGETRGYGTVREENAAGSGHRFTLVDLIPETIYHARVGFYDEDSSYRFSVDIPFKTSSPDSPAPPARIAVTGIPTFGVIDLEWDASPTGTVNGYRLYRRVNNASWTVVANADFGPNSRTFSDRTASGGMYFEYGVSALDANTAESDLTKTARVFMPGYIQADVYLTASDSPVLMTADLIIAPGATLHVGAGVEFQVAASDAFQLGKDPEMVEILVQGRILFNGTEANPIRFSPLNGIGKRDYWGGITIYDGGTGQSEVAFTHLSGCAGFALLAEGAEASFHDVMISFCNSGIRVMQVPSFPTIERCTIRDVASTAVAFDRCRVFTFSENSITEAGLGLLVVSDPDQNRIRIHENTISTLDDALHGTFRWASIRNNLLISRRGTGVRMLEAVDDANYLDHNTIDAVVGVWIDKGLPTIENNVIIDLKEDGEYGIRYTPTGNPQFPYNNLYGFTQAYLGCAAGEMATALEPDFRYETPFLYRFPEASLFSILDRNGGELGRYGKSYR